MSGDIGQHLSTLGNVIVGGGVGQIGTHRFVGGAPHSFQSQVEGDLNPYNSKAKKRKRKSSTNAAEKPGPNVSVTAAKKNLKLYNVTLVEGTKAVAEGRYKKPGPTKLNDLADEDYIQPVSIADDATPEDIAAAVSQAFTHVPEVAEHGFCVLRVEAPMKKTREGWVVKKGTSYLLKPITALCGT
ncbi:hypothetical protein B0H10DRAFT_2221279 [Mycena sp. CBHHK59/15]|nr:hypothetical protein B0H10DRAFT_2239458 [Mycena sp. CBHHK59/15]KAJ6614537.1 hypothetical protein B0H10DRAFT_2221279 [Mycena sp. CBHHK59/15]